jgi:hypothetical protein
MILFWKVKCILRRKRWLCRERNVGPERHSAPRRHGPRAERRVGELLKEMARADPAASAANAASVRWKGDAPSDDATSHLSEYAQALDDMGMSRQTALAADRRGDASQAVREGAEKMFPQVFPQRGSSRGRGGTTWPSI